MRTWLDFARERAEDIIVLHVAGWTLHDTAKLFGISRERVRQIVHKYMGRGALFHWGGEKNKQKPYKLSQAMRRAMLFFNERGQTADIHGRTTILLNEQHLVSVHATFHRGKTMSKHSPWYDGAIAYWRTHVSKMGHLHVVVLPHGAVIPVFADPKQGRVLYIRPDVPNEPPPDALSGESHMKRTQSTSIICALCHKGVRYHHGPESAFIETVPGPNGIPIKQAFHIKRCWPTERKRRKKELRALERTAANPVDREIETAMRINKELDSHMEITIEKPERAGKPGPRRGIGQKAFEIMDAIPVGQEWTTKNLIEKLAVHGMTTTLGSIRQMIWVYRKQRRPAVNRRRTTGHGRGAENVYMFEVPAPAEPATTVTAHPAKYIQQAEQRAQELKAFKEELIAERQKPDPVGELRKAVPDEKVFTRPEPPQPDPPVTLRPLVKPAPAPSLTHADINRAFNDIQAFILEALMDFRNDLLKKLK